jgi:hypothetical protein
MVRDAWAWSCAPWRSAVAAGSTLLDYGNVLRSWDPLDDHAELPAVDSSWTVVASTRLAVLDHRFAAVTAR